MSAGLSRALAVWLAAALLAAGAAAERLPPPPEGWEPLRFRRIERETLIETLRSTGGNVTRAAERLGRSRAAVYRLAEKHGLPLRREY